MSHEDVQRGSRGVLRSKDISLDKWHLREELGEGPSHTAKGCVEWLRRIAT